MDVQICTSLFSSRVVNLPGKDRDSMVRCWASVLGDCSDVQSREHYLSRALWLGEGITIKGFDWLHGETKTVGIDSLVAKILCEKHNNLLSPLDAEAADTFHTITKILEVAQERGKTKLSKRYWRVEEHSADGRLFERWAAKYALGLFCVVGKDWLWHQTGSEPLNPPKEMVRAIYGLGAFEKPAGLYLAATSGESLNHVDGISAAPLFHPDGGLVGAHFEFKGFRLVIWLSNENLDSFLLESAGTEFGPKRNQLMYHPRNWQFASRNIITQRLIFEW